MSSVLSRFKELAGNLIGYLKGMSENPRTPVVTTARSSPIRAWVGILLPNVIATHNTSAGANRSRARWRLWDHCLGTIGHDYIGTVTLTWEYDRVNVFHVRARHTTQYMGPDNLSVRLDIDTVPKPMANGKKWKLDKQLNPMGMDVFMHISLYRRFAKNTGEFQIFPTLARSYSIEVDLRSDGTLSDMTDYALQVHEKDWEQDKSKAIRQKKWGLLRID